MWDQVAAKRLGSAIRARRSEAKLSQEALAHQAGITKNQLQLLEAGRSTGRADASGPSSPRLSTLTGLANVFGVSVSELLIDANL